MKKASCNCVLFCLARTVYLICSYKLSEKKQLNTNYLYLFSKSEIYLLGENVDIELYDREAYSNNR